MLKSNIKRNIILFVTLAIAIAAIIFAFAIAPRSAQAEGNNSGASGAVSDHHKSIIMDVNGIDSISSATPDSAANIDTNNTKHWRVRYFEVSALLPDKVNGHDYKFVADSIVNGGSAVKVSIRPNTNDQTLVVEAVKMTIPEENAYFSVKARYSSGGVTDEVLITFDVRVDDTLVMMGDPNAGGLSGVNEKTPQFYVGHKVEFAADGMHNEYYPSSGNYVSSYKDGVHSSILTVNNYSTLTINLQDYLAGRALYYEPADGGDGKYGSPVKSGNNFWTINSVTNFKISNPSFVNLGGVIKDPIFSQSTGTSRIAPVLSCRIEADSETIRDYKGDFWSSTQILSLTLSQVTGTSSDKTIYIPVRFSPYNPQIVDIRSDWMRLNVTSKNTLNFESKTYFDENGVAVNDRYDYSSILIRPTDLIEYSHPSDYPAMTFLYTGTLLNGSHEDLITNGLSVTREAEDAESDNRRPSVLRITGTPGNLANSSFTVTFAVEYYISATNYETITVDLSVETYGGYIVNFSPINGKKAVSYNVLNAAEFAEMRERGYLLTAATSNNIDQLGVDLNNNVLTLTPNVNRIDGQTTADLELTFTNNSNQTITFTSGTININVNAGSLFARFEDWQAWLIIAACILGGLIIIMLIVWLFIHSISKHKQDELATQAPVSSYIVKLNSTIAATQAQQRAAQTQALSQASAQMLLGAGPVGTNAPPPDTLALASGGAMSQPGTMSMPGSAPAMSEPMASVPPSDGGEDLEALIAKYITDEELLERIFTEKYEPKGMIRRTFFKSKDLQARELDKEKKRIIERYKTPMPMDEAIMSESEIEKASATSSPAASTPQETEPSYAEMFTLDFDPDAPLYVEEPKPADEFADEKIDIDVSPEEARVRELEHRDAVLAKELEELKARMDKLQAELDKAKSIEDELREKIAKAEADDEQYGKDIEQLEFSLATAKNKDKERITRDIGIKEEKKQRNLDDLEKLKKELEALLGSSEKLVSVNTNYTDILNTKTTEREKIASDMQSARADYDAYLERLRQVQARQELQNKVQSLTPLLVDVNNTDYEIRRIDERDQKLDKERDTLKDAVAAAKSQIMGATDFGVISDLNTRISDANSRLSEIEKEVTASTKRRSSLNIEFNAQRRKANEFCQTNDIPVEEVVKAEDLVIGNIELDIHKALREKDKEEAEKAVAAAHAVYDDLSASADDVTIIAMDVASGIKDLEDELETLQAELDAVNAQMETASDDEQLILMVEQGDKTDKIEELKKQLEQANIEGTKRKMEAQAEYDAKLENARVALEEAQTEHEKACAAYDELINNTNPLDLIVSGSGVISQDQKKIEAENLKKQLERSKNEIEQARLAAQMAQEQAEQARLDAERASEEARLEAERAAAEAERNAQEAIAQAEQARLEAEEKARKEVEDAARAQREAEEARAAEAEEAKRKAQEEAEEAQRKAQEEAEEAKRKAQEEAEEAQRRVQEEAEEAKRRAEEEAEEAKRKAQEEIEEMRRKAEEEAEAKRLEEENRRKEEEEKQKADAEKAEVIAKKVAMRKEQIIAIRNEMKELKGDEDAKNLRERLYNIQLTFDEDEKGSSELMSFYNKTMDDISNSGEIARLKAENAKKPQRVVRKVTERVNRIPKHKPSQRPRPGARPAAARPGVRPGARPAGARPGARPGARLGARPAARPGARPGTRPPRPRP